MPVHLSRLVPLSIVVQLCRVVLLILPLHTNRLMLPVHMTRLVWLIDETDLCSVLPCWQHR